MTTSDSDLEQWERRATLGIWAAVLLTLLVIPLRIIGYGYLPADDALRHAAKAVSEKPWTEILVMRPDITIDHNPGWHAILGALHRGAGWDADTLVAFSVVALFLLFVLSALPWLRRRPEAWVLALLISMMTATNPIFRLTLGRPYILSMTVVLGLLNLWTPGPAPRRPWGRIAASALLVGLAVWIHGSWYLFVLPVAAFAAARRWREAAWVALASAAGILLGAALTGEPLRFLVGHLNIVRAALGQGDLQRMLVGEFQPTDGLLSVVFVLALVLLAKNRFGKPGLLHDALRDPVFMLMLIGWMMGLKVGRFWHDWGMPAFLLWLARELTPLLQAAVQGRPFFRLGLAGFACVSLYLSCTSDLAGRWTRNLTQAYLTPDDPELAGWLPDRGGIIYSDDMTLFYQTFFKNPHADWRYILGYEASLMPAEDLEIFRKIQWNFSDMKAFEPWVAKLRPQDRLILRRAHGDKPDLPALEWHYGATGLWIGRSPRAPGAKPEAAPAHAGA